MAKREPDIDHSCRGHYVWYLRIPLLERQQRQGNAGNVSLIQTKSLYSSKSVVRQSFDDDLFGVNSKLSHLSPSLHLDN